MDRIPVLITTAHKGVFFAYIDAGDRTHEHVMCHNARCAIWWGTTRGFLELALTGPTAKSRIGAVSPGALYLRNVVSVADVSAEAEAAWLAT